MFAGKGDINEGVQCARGEMPGNRVRRRARPVPRPDGIVPHRRTLARHQLSVHGRLRGPWILQRGDCHIARRS